MGKRRRICRDRPDQEPAEHDASGEKHGAFEQLSIVELSSPRKTPERINATTFRRGLTIPGLIAVAPQPSFELLNNVIRPREKRRRDRQAERS